jgi:hypothetical protein
MNTGIRSWVTRWMIFTALAILTACSHQPKRIDCDKRLELINAVTPAATKAGDP